MSTVIILTTSASIFREEHNYLETSVERMQVKPSVIGLSEAADGAEARFISNILERHFGTG